MANLSGATKDSAAGPSIPLAVWLVAGLLVAVGVNSILSMSVGGRAGTPLISLNFVALWIAAGLLRGRSSSRIVSLFFAGCNLLAVSLLVGVSLYGHLMGWTEPVVKEDSLIITALIVASLVAWFELRRKDVRAWFGDSDREKLLPLGYWGLLIGCAAVACATFPALKELSAFSKESFAVVAHLRLTDGDGPIESHSALKLSSPLLSEDRSHRDGFTKLRRVSITHQEGATLIELAGVLSAGEDVEVRADGYLPCTVRIGSKGAGFEEIPVVLQRKDVAERGAE